MTNNNYYVHIIIFKTDSIYNISNQLFNESKKYCRTYGQPTNEKSLPPFAVEKGGKMKNSRDISEASEHFSSLFPKGQEWFSPKEAGYIIGRSDQFVRNSFYSGKIFGHLSNGLAKRGEEKKTYMRVHSSLPDGIRQLYPRILHARARIRHSEPFRLPTLPPRKSNKGQAFRPPLSA